MKNLNPKDMKEYYSLPRMRHRNASVKKGEREKCRHNRRRAQKERSGIAKWCYRFDEYGLPGGNRTHNRDLGGPRYIHLTTRRNIDFKVPQAPHNRIFKHDGRKERAEKYAVLPCSRAWAYGGPSGARTQDQPVMSR